MTTVDYTLQTALFDWRDEQAAARFNLSVLETFGSGLLLSDEIITRIVDCAQASKLFTIPHLIKETGWREDWANELGDSLLSVVRRHQPTVAVDSEPSTSRKRGTVTCSACGTKGHISMLNPKSILNKFSEFTIYTGSNNTCPVRVAASAARHQAVPAAYTQRDENTAPNPLPNTNIPQPWPRLQPLSTTAIATNHDSTATMSYQVPAAHYYPHVLQPTGTFIQQPLPYYATLPGYPTHPLDKLPDMRS